MAYLPKWTLRYQHQHSPVCGPIQQLHLSWQHEVQHLRQERVFPNWIFRWIPILGLKQMTKGIQCGENIYLHHLLMSSLHWAIALVDVVDIAVLVTKNLNLGFGKNEKSCLDDMLAAAFYLNMANTLKILFNQQLIRAKCTERFTLSSLNFLLQSGILLVRKK